MSAHRRILTLQYSTEQWLCIHLQCTQYIVLTWRKYLIRGIGECCDFQWLSESRFLTLHGGWRLESNKIYPQLSGRGRVNSTQVYSHTKCSKISTGVCMWARKKIGRCFNKCSQRWKHPCSNHTGPTVPQSSPFLASCK